MGLTEDIRRADPTILARVAEDSNYRRLLRERSRFGWQLSAIMIAIFFGYISLIAYDKSFLARPIAGGATTLGIPIGIGVILAGVGLTGIYVRRANRQFDALVEKIREDVGQ